MMMMNSVSPQADIMLPPYLLSESELTHLESAAACSDQRNGCLHRLEPQSVLRGSARTPCDGGPAALLFSG